ncbi:hypothetical protein [Methylorubrum aminovorans]|uniref:hypothetical protein n=1 Tax=Methylorubrum aminovorans TaxID=269069 RepID=UPI003C2F87FD
MAKVRVDTPRRSVVAADEKDFAVEVEALTIPNARCPVCNATVFFYKNDYGSRVYFDRLGPPWPKHPCTDRTSQQTQKTYTVYEGRYYWGQPVDWQEHGWQPFRFVSARKNGMAVVCDMQTEIEFVSNLPAKMFDDIWRLFYMRQVEAEPEATEISSYLLQPSKPYNRTIKSLMLRRNRPDQKGWHSFSYWAKVIRTSLYF